MPTLPLLTLLSLSLRGSAPTPTGRRGHRRIYPFDSWLIRSLDLSAGLMKRSFELALRRTGLVLTLTGILSSIPSERQEA